MSALERTGQVTEVQNADEQARRRAVFMAQTEYIAWLRALPYESYLQTHHWRDIREWALMSAGKRCQLCGNESELQVHHKTYVRLGCELLSDLNVLCRSCHAKFHDKAV